MESAGGSSAVSLLDLEPSLSLLCVVPVGWQEVLGAEAPYECRRGICLDADKPDILLLRSCQLWSMLRFDVARFRGNLIPASAYYGMLADDSLTQCEVVFVSVLLSQTSKIQLQRVLLMSILAHNGSFDCQ